MLHPVIIIDYAMKHIHRCKLDESNGKRKMSVGNIPTPEAAMAVFDEILPQKQE